MDISACRTVRVLLALTLTVALGAVPGASAHPHAWIDLRSAIVMSASGRVVAIEQEWLFDPLYTSLITDARGTAPAALQAEASAIVERLREHRYFTEIRIDGERVTPGRVQEFEGGLQSGRYRLRFVVPLETRPDPTRQTLSYAVFDPTYYIEILHLEKDIIEFRGSKAGSCLGRIVPPSPSMEAIIRARAVDVDARPDDSLGALFAEQVTIRCR